MPHDKRANTFHRGSLELVESEMGYADCGTYLLDTARSGNSNGGHDYGTDLTSGETRELIEFLKTL